LTSCASCMRQLQRRHMQCARPCSFNFSQVVESHHSPSTWHTLPSWLWSRRADSFP
jgi:hypothetical protein